MRVLINILTLIAALVGFLSLCLIVWGLGRNGFSDGKGMALVAFQLWVAIGCIAAFILGIIGYFMARSGERDADVASDIGVGVGLTGILLYLLMLIFS